MPLSTLPPLPALPRGGDRIHLPSLAGSADALALAQLAQKGRLLAVLTANAADAQRLLEEIPWFAPDLKVRLLPDWETLPYDNFSPHHDLVSERLATLYAVTRGECDVLLVPASTAVYRLTPCRMDLLAMGARFAENGFFYIYATFVLAYATQSLGMNRQDILNGVLDVHLTAERAGHDDPFQVGRPDPQVPHQDLDRRPDGIR